MYQTYPQQSADAEIVYQIITPPKQGVLLLSSSRLEFSRNSDAKLRQGSTFNQVDLLSGHLKYRLTSSNIKKSLDDKFTFKVGVKSDGKSNIQVRILFARFLMIIQIDVKIYLLWN